MDNLLSFFVVLSFFVGFLVVGIASIIYHNRKNKKGKDVADSWRVGKNEY